MCRNCRFVPIGAGLDKLPKKKKRRARRYVEPGSAMPLLTWGFIGLVGFGCYQYKPWQDDWELVRSLLGQGRRHNLVGEWEVTKTLTIKKSKANLFGSKLVQRGTFKFTKQGKVSVELVRAQGKMSGSGQYVVSGQTVALRSLQSQTANSQIPPSLKLKLSWSGPDNVIATNGSEAIYLHRRPKGSPVANLMQMGLKPGSAQAPGKMRGVIATLQENIDAQSEE